MEEACGTLCAAQAVAVCAAQALAAQAERRVHFHPVCGPHYFSTRAAALMRKHRITPCSRLHVSLTVA